MRGIDAIEDALSQRIVTAFAEIAALVVAAADVEADSHVGRPAGQRLIGCVDVEIDQIVGIGALRLDVGADEWVGEQHDRHLIELDVAATSRGQRRDLLGEGPTEIGEERCKVGVDMRAVRSPWCRRNAWSTAKAA